MKELIRIPVAFCFDDNMWMLGGVAITSLLYHAMDKCAYDVYCVVPDTFAQSKQDELIKLVSEKDSNSKIHFLKANHDFDESSHNEYTIGIYFRFMLLKLLPDVDKIIYSDVDVTFSDNLIDMYNTEMGDNLIAAVPDADQGRPYPKKVNGYINSGVLIMNLKKIREYNYYDTWLSLSKTTEFRYIDQDILNKTCDGKILYLPMRYNYMAGNGTRLAGAVSRGVYTQQEYEEAIRNPAIIHYILRQPWKNKEHILGSLWWKYCYMTPFYAYFYNNINHESNLIKKDILLFNCIKVLTIKVRQTKVKYYLFGFIPLFVVNKSKKI